MKYFDGRYYVEVKDHRYKNYLTENIILRLRNPPNSLRTRYQVQKESQIRKNQRVVKHDSDELIVKKYPKEKQPIIEQPNFKPPNCPNCKQIPWVELD